MRNRKEAIKDLIEKLEIENRELLLSMKKKNDDLCNMQFQHDLNTTQIEVLKKLE